MLCARANGSFFLPASVPTMRGLVNNISQAENDKGIDRYDGFYLGEYPYHFAASLGNEPAMDLIWKRAKELGMSNPCFWQDGAGNTALHLAVQYCILAAPVPA